MMDVKGRSSKLKTFCTIWCSCASITPASTPSTKLALISSSVTVRKPRVSICSHFNITLVLPDKKNTTGFAIVASANIKGAVKRATDSGNNCPIRLGTNSPNKIVLSVIKVTTHAVARPSANRSATPCAINQRDKFKLNAASPTIPLSTPIEVIPICTVDKNCVGCASKRKAARAPESPSASSATKRGLRHDAKAISDIANMPLNSVRRTIRKISMGTRLRHWV